MLHAATQSLCDLERPGTGRSNCSWSMKALASNNNNKEGMMQEANGRISLGVAVFGLVLWSMAGMAHRAWAGNEMPITTAQGRQVSPKASGNLVVWMDRRNGNWDIYLYDIARSREWPIATGTKDQRSPAIDGKQIVWLETAPSSGYNVMLCNFNDSTGQCSNRIVAFTSTYFMDVAVSGNLVVWAQQGAGVYLYDIARLRTLKLANAPGNNVEVSGNRIVWIESPLGAIPSLKMCDYDAASNTCPARQITQDTYLTDLAVDGNRLAWDRAVLIPRPFFGFTLVRSVKFCTFNPLTGACPVQTVPKGAVTTVEEAAPAIAGDRIVYMAFPTASQADIYLYQMATNTVQVLLSHPKHQNAPDISEALPGIGNHVVWQDWRNDNGTQTNDDIYRLTVP